jgi:hypothetical protein
VFVRRNFTGKHERVPTTGRHLYDYTICNGFYDALEASPPGAPSAREDPIVFHDLSHTFGTLAVQAFPLNDVKPYIAHEDISPR